MFGHNQVNGLPLPDLQVPSDGVTQDAMLTLTLAAVTILSVTQGTQKSVNGKAS